MYDAMLIPLACQPRTEGKRPADLSITHKLSTYDRS
jgi:hypothetical protein